MKIGHQINAQLIHQYTQLLINFRINFIGVLSKHFINMFLATDQGSGNFEIWIGPADDDDVINEPISKKKKMCISPVTKTNDNWQSYNSF